MTIWFIGLVRIEPTIVSNRNDCIPAQLLRTDTRVLKRRRPVQVQSKWKASEQPRRRISMMNRVKSRSLVTTVVLLAGVGFASAQGVGSAGGGAGGAASEKGMASGGHSGGPMGSGASGGEGASHNERMTQGAGSESRESGRTEGPSARGSESSRGQREESGTQERGRAEGPRDSSKRRDRIRVS